MLMSTLQSPIKIKYETYQICVSGYVFWVFVYKIHVQYIDFGCQCTVCVRAYISRHYGNNSYYI